MRQQPGDIAQGLCNCCFIQFLTRLGLFGQPFDLAPERPHRVVQGAKNFGTLGDLFFRGNHGHSGIYLSRMGPPTKQTRKSGLWGFPHGRLPISSSMSQFVDQTVRNVNKNSINNILHQRAVSIFKGLRLSPRGQSADTPKDRQIRVNCLLLTHCLLHRRRARPRSAATAQHSRYALPVSPQRRDRPCHPPQRRYIRSHQAVPRP